MKLVLFGGSFDPVHIGHTTVAEAAAERIGAEQLVFIPAKRSPLKGFSPGAADHHRLAMIRLAIAGRGDFAVSDCELAKPAPSYTLQTVKSFQAEYGCRATIHWLIGADTVDDLQHWYAIEELIDCCNLCTMYRAGCNVPDYRRFEKLWGAERVEKLQRNIIPTPLVDVSSSEIRRKLAEGADVGAMLHPAVADYITKHGLYKAGPRA